MARPWVITSEIAATGMNALLMKLATGVGDSGWEDQIKGLGIPVKAFNATLKKDAPAAIKILLGAINKIGDGTKKMSVLKEMFGQEYADDIARLSSNLGGLERMLGFVGDKAKFLGSVDKSFELLKEKDYNRLARFSAQMDRLAISVGGPLKTGLGAAADQASRLFESFQEGGAAAKALDALNEAAKRYNADQIARQEAAGEPRRAYDPETRKAIDQRHSLHQAHRDKEQRDAVDKRVADLDAQIGEKQKRLDRLPMYPRLRAKPEGEIAALRGERDGITGALSARDRANIALIENEADRKRLQTRHRGFGDYYGDKPQPIIATTGAKHSATFGLGPYGTSGIQPSAVPVTPTMRTRDAKGRSVTVPQPLPPIRPESLPKAVPFLKSFDDIYAVPKVDTTSVDAAGAKAGEVRDKLSELNQTVTPTVNMASLQQLESAVDRILTKMQQVGASAGSAKSAVAGIGSAPAGRGRSDIATATANLSRSRQLNNTGREFTG